MNITPVEASQRMDHDEARKLADKLRVISDAFRDKAVSANKPEIAQVCNDRADTLIHAIACFEVNRHPGTIADKLREEIDKLKGLIALADLAFEEVETAGKNISHSIALAREKINDLSQGVDQ